MKSTEKLLWIVWVFASCKKPYTPTAITAKINYLVVEGVINNGLDSTIIKLSRTVNLSSVVAKNPETNAIITIESDQNQIYELAEIKNGYYAIAGLNLDKTRKYRLRIKTGNNQQYLSEQVEVKDTPPIDSIGFTIVNGGLQIYANTHDPKNSTRYYRWDYQETWQFHSLYESTYVSNGKLLVRRTLAQQVYRCFGNNTSSSIILGSSAKLERDLIYQAPITTIAGTSEKLEIKYSILLRQYALTGEAFTFWQNLKTNTEQLGSIFDPLPTNINGNIHNIGDPGEPVIGYVSACTVQTKRIFITSDQVPKLWDVFYPYKCSQDTAISPVDIANLIQLPSASIPTNPAYVNGAQKGWLNSSAECVDCTIRGTIATPDFWK